MSVVDRSRTPPVRTPDPLASSRRRALERLGSLRTMGLGAIGDIGSVAFGSVQTLTWESATDWNSAVDENGVVHDTFGDLPGDDTVQLGYPNEDPGGTNLLHYWPLHASSSPPDIVTSTNATVTGATADAAGVFDTTSYNLDGTDDYIDSEVQGPTGSTNRTELFWFYPESQNKDSATLIGYGSDANTNRWGFRLDSGGTSGVLRVETAGDGYATNLQPTFNSWNFAAVTLDGSTLGDLTFYLNGSTESGSGSHGVNTGTNYDVHIGVDPILTFGDTFSDRYFTGSFAYVQQYDRALSVSELDDYYLTSSTNFLQTATKSFSIAQTPDLSSLDYDLNGESITIDVIGSPGQAGEETVSQTLDGSTSYGLTWSNSHTDFRVEPNLSTATATTTPVVRSITLSS